MTAKSATALTLKTQKEKASYALGMKIGGDLRKQGVNASVDPALAARGFKDALAGNKPLLTDDEERAAAHATAERGPRQAAGEGARSRGRGAESRARNFWRPTRAKKEW